MPKTILLVDDDSRITQVARDYLAHAGFAVVVAHDGPAALARYRAEKPALVVLDLGLPGLDGLDVARALRKESHVPIIMLTTHGGTLTVESVVGEGTRMRVEAPGEG